ncbi:hypothetical protein Tco_0952193 [Tanacetum coccineum]|uniref:Uncharacterized protein n=1 Tax=Tanacetum coccineum TaxID=301880 RepID=A0ABQ5DWX8_9ASTR
MRYYEMKQNRELLKKCIEEGPCELTQITLPDALADDENPRQPGRSIKETYHNTTLEKLSLIDVEAEAFHMILNGIGNDIYSTQDACPNAKEIWIAIERLQQGESINMQDLKTECNPLALTTATQHYPYNYPQEPQAPKPYKTQTPSPRQTTSTRSHATTRNKGKEIIKAPSPPSELAFEEDNNEEQA